MLARCFVRNSQLNRAMTDDVAEEFAEGSVDIINCPAQNYPWVSSDVPTFCCQSDDLNDSRATAVSEARLPLPWLMVSPPSQRHYTQERKICRRDQYRPLRLPLLKVVPGKHQPRSLHLLTPRQWQWSPHRPSPARSPWFPHTSTLVVA